MDKREQIERGSQITLNLLKQADALLAGKQVEPVTLAGALLAAGVNVALQFSTIAEVAAKLRSLAAELESPERPGTVQ